MALKSGFERTIFANLESRGVGFTYETLQLPYILENTYNPDFILANGIIVEAKGLLDYDDRRKHLAVKRQHPELDIRFCFMQANKKMPGLKSTHAQWANKNGFLWCEGKIPEEWTD